MGRREMLLGVLLRVGFAMELVQVEKDDITQTWKAGVPVVGGLQPFDLMEVGPVWIERNCREDQIKVPQYTPIQFN